MRVESTVELAWPRTEVWAAVSDPEAMFRGMAGMTRWRPVAGKPARGLGARYDVLIAVGSVQVGGEVEVVEFHPPEELAWTSVTGLAQRGRWRLREVAPNRTRATLRLSYQAPGGLLGLLATVVATPTVRGNLERTLAELPRYLAGSHR